jgi:hypothetical protein
MMPAMDLSALDRLSRDLAGAGRAHDAATRGERRGRGVVFTPAPLAAFVARDVLAPLGVDAPVVLDPACGDGRFLAAARDATAGRARLIGVERDPDLAAAARRAVPGATIVVGEALLDSLAIEPVDAVIGNPPWVRSIRLKQRDPVLWRALRGRFAATSSGEWDLYAAFIERSLAWVRPGGRVGLVVPSRWLTAQFARGLRAELAAAGALRAVIDFGAAQVFPDATTYASVVVLERPAIASPPPHVAVARRDDDGAWDVGELDGRRLDGAPWRLPVGAAARAFARLAGGPTLGDVARIAKGAGTNADPVFIVGDDVDVEPAATRPCLRGRDVGGAAPPPRCIVPYDDGALIAWSELARRWPRAAAHLAAHRAVLERRERGRFAGARFHAFGRPQNLTFHLDRAPKVVFPDVALDARAVLDTTGALVIDSAYAARPIVTDGPWADPMLLLALLGSPVIRAWLAVGGVPLRGGYTRMKTAFLAPLPLPPPERGATLASAADAIARGDRGAADDALVDAYGLASVRRG